MSNSIFLKKLNIKSLKSIFIVLLTLVFILFSKTMFFGVEHRSKFQIIFYFLSFVALFVLNGINRTFIKNIVQCLLISLFFLCHIIFNYNDMSSGGVNTIFGYILTFLCCSLFSSSITKELFLKTYIFLITFICIVSIPCYLISVFDEDLAKSLCSTSMDWNNQYEYSWYYTFGRHGFIVPRNSGPFWEPGAFQGFIILGMLFLFLHNQNKVDLKEKKWLVFSFVIMLITLITTQSTTGYILLILLIIVFYKNMISLFSSRKNKKTIILVLSLLILSTIFIIVFSNNIYEKLNNVNNNSASIRKNDFIGSMLIIFNYGGLFGLGQTNTKILIENIYNIELNSVGLFNLGYTFGLIFMLFYMLRLYKGVNSFFNFQSKFVRVLIYIIFIILHLTEGLWFLPIYVLFLQQFKRGN